MADDSWGVPAACARPRALPAPPGVSLPRYWARLGRGEATAPACLRFGAPPMEGDTGLAPDGAAFSVAQKQRWQRRTVLVVLQHAGGDGRVIMYRTVLAQQHYRVGLCAARPVPLPPPYKISVQQRTSHLS
jgi:hypothetical protein